MKWILFPLLFLLGTNGFSQSFTRYDSLRGSITEERVWWDLNYYHLDIEVDPSNKTIKGSNLIQYEVLEPHDVIQIDLQGPMKMLKAIQNGEELTFSSERNAHFIQLKTKPIKGEVNAITIEFEGKAREAVRAPWDGGISWKKDAQGNDFIASSCQGLGASVWWPCKDHMYDEVDSMLMSVEVPESLMDVSNGRLRRVDAHPEKKTKTYHWFVSNPINNYGVNINIGDYVFWDEKYQGEKGELDVFYYALRADEESAKKQFKEVPRMLEAFEHWFGPYPFYEDGYKLVQVPYLGMEHQSSVTYGNGFKNGYLGRDLSGTGWGLKFDFIIVHESGHEWFANNITHKDMADMWIHESFTNYSESLFLDYHFGKEAGREYVRGLRTSIENRIPMIGYYDVNYEGYPIDVYYKGSNVLNTLRSILDDDDRWRAMLREINAHFYHQTVTSEEFENKISEALGMRLDGFFDQYLRDSRIPTLEYYFKEGRLYFRWTNVHDAFNMVVDVQVEEDKMRIEPTTTWDSIKVKGDCFIVDPNYYISLLKLN